MGQEPKIESAGQILWPYSGPPPDPSRERTILVAECGPWGQCLTVRDGAGGGINLPVEPLEELDDLEVLGVVAVAGGIAVAVPWHISDDTFTEECYQVLACFREYASAFNEYKRAVAAVEARGMSTDVSKYQQLLRDLDEKWSDACSCWTSLTSAIDALLSHPVYLRVRDDAAKLKHTGASS